MTYAKAYATPESMGIERHVRLFRNGRNRAVRIPRDLDFFGEEAIIRREGDRLIMETPPLRQTLAEVLASLEPLEEEWPEIDDPPPEPVDF